MEQGGFALFHPAMFTQGFMVNALVSGTLVAIIAAVVGFFVVLRGFAFLAHALPRIGFAGAAGAVLLGITPIVGLVTFATGGALSVGLFRRRTRHDVVIALTLVVALGTGALFLVLSNTYATGAYALLFGQLVGVSRAQVVDTGVLAVACAAILTVIYRPLLFVSITEEGAQARGIAVRFIDVVFFVVVGLTTAITVPVVGALLSFSLMIGPAAATTYLTHHPLKAIGLSVVISICTVWIALVLGYDTGWPIGFFVAAVSTAFYAVTRLSTTFRRFA